MREVSMRLLVAASVALAACGPGEPDEPPPFLLSTSAGTYSDGSGRVGLATLVTLRDADGLGPIEPWSGVLERDDVVIGTFQYSGSSLALWWPDVPASEGSAFRLRLGTGGDALVADLIVPAAGLAPALVDIASDGQRLRWSAVQGAASYVCEVQAAGLNQLRATSTATECDVSALPAGSFTARVLAFGANPAAVDSSPLPAPPMPDRFDVSEGRFAFTRGDGGELRVAASAAGGVLHYGAQAPALAVWLALRTLDGSPPDVDFSVRVIGPGLPEASPLTFVYPAGAARHLVWAYDIPAVSGSYSLTASSETDTLSSSFAVDSTGTGLPLPTDLDVVELGSGGADASWTPVAGAQSYYVGVWTRSTGAFAAGHWVAGATSTRFATGTFVAGVAYDVYIAASDFDMTSAGPAPARISVSENTYSPAAFTAKDSE